MRIAVIGSGISGLGVAWLLRKKHDVYIYEKNSYAGGHTNTLVDNGQAVDTGFIVYNRKNYPRLVTMFDALNIETQTSNMSFSASIDNGRTEWATRNLDTVFAQRKNLLSLSHYRMLADVIRFHRQAKKLLEQAQDTRLTIDEFILRYGYTKGFRECYLIPIASSIWSTPPTHIGEYPVASLIRFFNNHGLLETSGQPEWRTVTNGARTYVQRICEQLDKHHVYLNRAVQAIRRSEGHVSLIDAQGEEKYDQVILASHADESLKMLGEDVSDIERRILSQFKFTVNRAVLHSDTRLMPKLRKVWAAWNYLSNECAPNQKVCLTYWMNRLQSIPDNKLYFVTLNPFIEPENSLVIREIIYQHPVFDTDAVRAQDEISSIQGVNRTWFCGAWCGYGFHEDGLASAEGVARGLGVSLPW